MTKQGRSGRLGRIGQGMVQVGDVFLLLISPLMMIGFIIAAVMLLAEFGEHRQFVRRLEEEGRVTQATVESLTSEHAWAHVTYPGEDGDARFGVLDMDYYASDVWDTLQVDRTVEIRYLPWHLPNSDRVILNRRFEAVRRYRGYLTADLLSLLGICWLALVIKPQLLYVGLVDTKILFPEEGAL
jgi:hypothetical protein